MSDRSRRHRPAPARAAAARRLAVQPGPGGRSAHVSPATCLRRVRRLVDAGVIERRVALLSPERLGAGLTAIVEVTLDRQGAEHLDAFERAPWPTRAVQQCYRVSPGPDFVLVVWTRRHAGLPGAGAAPVHAGRQRAQREGLLQRARAPSSSRASAAVQWARSAHQQRQPLEVLALRETAASSGGRRPPPGAAGSARRPRHRCRRRRRSCGTARRRCRPSTRR